MKKTALLVMNVVMLALVVIATVSVAGQEFITEEEFASRFESDPLTLYESCKANNTVVIPTLPYNSTYRQGMLWKIVKDDAANYLTGALVTVEVPVGVYVKWYNGTWQTGSDSMSSISGYAVFFLAWEVVGGVPLGIIVNITVSMGGFSTIEDEQMTIYGAIEYIYRRNEMTNQLSPLPPIPELSLAMPLVISIGTGAYFALRRKLNKAE